jgi:hypothetical protein
MGRPAAAQDAAPGRLTGPTANRSFQTGQPCAFRGFAELLEQSLHRPLSDPGALIARTPLLGPAEAAEIHERREL